VGKRKKSESPREVIPSVLNAGDSIEISVSHQIYVDGDQSWVSYKVYSRVAEDESSSDTHARVMTHIRTGLDDTINKVVEHVREKVEQ
jgi:hypothetical protein